MTTPPVHMTTQELAAYLRTTPAAIRQMRQRGTGPVGYRVGRHVLYRTDEVEEWLATRRLNPEA